MNSDESKSPLPSASLPDGLAEAVLADVAQGGMMLADTQWKLIYCDAEGAKRIDQPPKLGEDLWPQLGQVSADERMSVRRDIAAGKGCELVTPLAEGRWLYTRFSPYPGGVALLLRSATKEVQSRVAARSDKERLRDLNESLKLAHRAAKAATWEWRAGQRLRWTDLEAAGGLIGRTETPEGEPAVPDWMSFILPEDAELAMTNLRRMTREGQGDVEFRVRAADGRIQWLQASGMVIERDASGAATRMVGVTVDTTDRKAVEGNLQAELDERRRAEARQRMLVMELNQRVKNTLATVQSIARQTLRGVPEGRRLFEDFEARLVALSWAHDVLTAEGWAGADLDELVRNTLRPHEGAARGIARIEGPVVKLLPHHALAVALAVHELATNALKYGALSAEGGRVDVAWALDPTGKELTLTWRESGGPPVTAPTGQGFGTRLLRHGLAAELGAPVDLHFHPDGLECVLRTLLPDSGTMTDEQMLVEAGAQRTSATPPSPRMN